MQKAAPTPVSVILPAYNEETGVGPQVKAIRQVLRSRRMSHEILVVDDGSKDHTAEEALQAGARVLRHPENRGYGAALKTGIVAAKYDTIVIIDADGTYPPEQIPALITELSAADMAVGARTGDQVQIPWARRPAKWVLSWLAARISGKVIPDLNSGLRAFRRECVLQYFSILSNQFSFTTTVTLAFLADDYRVVYCPINYYKRLGNSKITPRHFMEFTMLVLRMAMLFHPLRIFVPLAALCGVMGIFKVVFDVTLVFPRVSTFGWATLLSQPVLSTSSLLLSLAALQLLLVGMVAEGLLRRISQRQRLVPSRAIWASETVAAQELPRHEISRVKEDGGDL